MTGLWILQLALLAPQQATPAFAADTPPPNCSEVTRRGNPTMEDGEPPSAVGVPCMQTPDGGGDPQRRTLIPRFSFSQNRQLVRNVRNEPMFEWSAPLTGDEETAARAAYSQMRSQFLDGRTLEAPAPLATADARARLHALTPGLPSAPGDVPGAVVRDAPAPVARYQRGQRQYQRDAEVLRDQRALVALGLGNPRDRRLNDGKYGGITDAAIQRFRQLYNARHAGEHGLLSTTSGELDEPTRQALRTAAADEAIRAAIRGAARARPEPAPRNVGDPPVVRGRQVRTGAVTVNENGDSDNEAAIQYAIRAGNTRHARHTALLYTEGRGPSTQERSLSPQRVAFGTVDMRSPEVPLGTLGVFTDPESGRRTVIVAGDTGRTRMEVSQVGHNLIGRNVGNPEDYRNGTCPRCTIQWFPGTRRPGGYRNEAELLAWMSAWGTRMGIPRPE